jgi:hypothetical protein
MLLVMYMFQLRSLKHWAILSLKLFLVRSLLLFREHKLVNATFIYLNFTSIYRVFATLFNMILMDSFSTLEMHRTHQSKFLILLPSTFLISIQIFIALKKRRYVAPENGCCWKKNSAEVHD